MRCSRRRYFRISGGRVSRHRAIGDLGPPEMRKYRRLEQRIERPDQEDDKADQRDQRSDLLAEPDLIFGWARRAALQRFGEPVEAEADGLMRNMLVGVRDCRRVEHPCGASCDVAIDLAGFDSALGADMAQSFGLCVTSRARSTPHIRLENSSYCANTSATLRGQPGVPSAANGLPVEDPSSTIDL